MRSSRDDDIDEVVSSARERSPNVTLHIVVLLSLICKAVRDLRRTNAT